METAGKKNNSIAPFAQRDKIDAWWWLVAAVIALALFLVIQIPDPYMRVVRFVKDGIWVTLYVTLITFVLVLVLGLFGGLGRLSTNPIIKGVAGVYVEVIRGIPVLVQLFFWYFAFPAIIQGLGNALGARWMIEFRPPGVVMAILGLTICYAAYMSEVYRAGIQSITKGQMEAARSLGMTYVQAMRYVVLPQAFRVILPPVGNEFVTLLKDTSLVSVVAVPDLTRRGREFMTATFTSVETWVMIALLYLILTLVSARVVSYLEQRSRMER